jgi:hypothetical protein
MKTAATTKIKGHVISLHKENSDGDYKVTIQSGSVLQSASYPTCQEAISEYEATIRHYQRTKKPVG